MKRIVVLLFLIFGVHYAGTAQQNQPVPRTLYVTVERDETDFLPGLKAENFKVFENKVEKPIVSFKSSAEPMSIGFMFDVSGSMSTEFVKDLNDAAAAIHNTVRGQSGDNEYFLIGFNKNVALLSDWTSEPEDISNGLKNLPFVEIKGAGSTAIYDACFTAIEKLNSSGKSKKVLIMFTDGADNNSKLGRNEIIRLASSSSILIYAVTLKKMVTPLSDSHGSSFGIQELEGREFLYDITGMTGGTTLFVDSGSPENIGRGPIKAGKTRLGLAFEKIFSELRSQYVIQYFPNKDKNKTYSVDIKVSLPSETKKGKGDVSLRYRKKFKAT